MKANFIKFDVKNMTTLEENKQEKLIIIHSIYLLKKAGLMFQK